MFKNITIEIKGVCWVYLVKKRNRSIVERSIKEFIQSRKTFSYLRCSFFVSAAQSIEFEIVQVLGRVSLFA